LCLERPWVKKLYGFGAKKASQNLKKQHQIGVPGRSN